MEILLVYLAGCPGASLPSFYTHPKPLSFKKKTKKNHPQIPNTNHTKQ